MPSLHPMPPTGYMPVKLQALPEGSVVHARCPVYQLTAEAPFAPLCTYLETLLTQVWYPTTVATLRWEAEGGSKGTWQAAGMQCCPGLLPAALLRCLESGGSAPTLLVLRPLPQPALQGAHSSSL